MYRTAVLQMEPAEIQKRESLDNREYRAAIGYLSTWNLSYEKVTIYARDELDMVAVYRSNVTDKQYVIGAVWNQETKRYSFHS